MPWQAAWCLGVEEMDSTHREFVELLEQCQGGERFADSFSRLLVHTEQHFANEEQLMRSSGYAAIDEHRGEHNKVLAEARQMARGVERGRLKMAKAWLNERLPEWFELHRTTMDAALAVHLKQHNES